MVRNLVLPELLEKDFWKSMNRTTETGCTRRTTIPVSKAGATISTPLSCEHHNANMNASAPHAPTWKVSRRYSSRARRMRLRVYW